MARLGKTLLFEKGVRDTLLEDLPEGFCADPERHPRAVRTTDWGEQYLWVSLIKGGLLNLGFGVIFRSFAEVDRIANGPQAPGRLDRAFSMSSMNMRQMKGLPYPRRFSLSLWGRSDEGFWHCTAQDSPAGVAQRLVGFIGGVVVPFFTRFSSLQAVRESLLHDDGWLISGREEDVLLIDIALDDKLHFDAHIRDNRDNRNFQMALQKLPTLLEKFPRFAGKAPAVEPGASPNGGPAEPSGISRAGGGPPSVS
jgi:hypothetical protein